jgi:hypothetical protein
MDRCFLLILLVIVYKPNKDFHNGKLLTAKKDYVMYLLAVFYRAKVHVSNHLLVHTHPSLSLELLRAPRGGVNR